MICGGRGEILLDYLDADEATNVALFAEAAEAVGHGGTPWLLTAFGEPGQRARSAGRHCLVRPDGSTIGTFAADPAVLARLVAEPGNRTIRVETVGDARIVVEPLPEFGPEFDAFWESARGGYVNLIVRDRAFLDWRFVRPPTRRYEILAARRDGRLLGYLVSTSTTVQGLKWAMIMDMFVSDSREGRSAASVLAGEHARRARGSGPCRGADVQARPGRSRPPAQRFSCLPARAFAPGIPNPAPLEHADPGAGRLLRHQILVHHHGRLRCGLTSANIAHEPMSSPMF